jgi:hypothetical protein
LLLLFQRSCFWQEQTGKCIVCVAQHQHEHATNGLKQCHLGKASLEAHLQWVPQVHAVFIPQALSRQL